MEAAAKRQPNAQFAREAATTILLAFAALELLSLAQIAPSPASTLPYPANIGTSSLIILFSLLGAYGLVARNPRWMFFAFLTPAWEAVLGGASLIADSQQGFQTAIAVQGSAALILGAASLWFALQFHKSLSQSSSDQTPSAGSNGSSSSEYAVQLVDTVKKYFVGPIVVSAIDGLTFGVKRGEFVAIMGPSGCGKSTLLNLIGALDKPTSGKVLIDGIDLSTFDERNLAYLRNEKIGFVFQSYNLINRSTVFRNVELPTLVKGLPKKDRERRVREMLEVVGIIDKAHRKPKMLSGGEQQRVAIARALINSPSLILADEPTGNLDSKSGKDIMSFMQKLNGETGTTIIIVTHDKAMGEMTDRIVYLRDGRIITEEKRGITKTEV